MSKLYVGNLTWDATQEEVRDLFSQHGEVKSVNLINDKETGKARGFGFVEMENADVAQQALDGQDFKGRALKISEARERQTTRN